MENNTNEEVVNVTGTTPQNKPEEKKGMLKWAIMGGVCLLLVTGVLSKVYEFGMNVLYSLVYGEDAEFYGASDYIDFKGEEENNIGGVKVDSDNTFTVYSDGTRWEHHASDWLIGNSSYVLNNYQVNIFDDMSEAEIYATIDQFHSEYIREYYDFFDDYTSYKATQMINDKLREEQISCFKIEGQVISIEADGNMYRIYDMYTTNEGVHAYDHGVMPDILDVYVDFSMLENKDKIYMNDYVTVYVYMLGTIPMQDGTSIPCLIALGAEAQ